MTTTKHVIRDCYIRGGVEIEMVDGTKYRIILHADALPDEYFVMRQWAVKDLNATGKLNGPWFNARHPLVLSVGKVAYWDDTLLLKLPGADDANVPVLYSE